MSLKDLKDFVPFQSFLQYFGLMTWIAADSRNDDTKPSRYTIRCFQTLANRRSMR